MHGFLGESGGEEDMAIIIHTVTPAYIMCTNAMLTHACTI